jgi:hypothetical protein
MGVSVTSRSQVLEPVANPAARGRYRGWVWLNILSLDAPVVALLWQTLFSRCLHVHIRWPARVALVLSTWLIYAVDRLLDARAPSNGTPSSRHEFSRQHSRLMLGVAGLVLPVLLWTCAHLKPVVFHNGLWMLAAVTVYFAFVHISPAPIRRLWPKEVAVGVLFSLGTCLATWSLAGQNESAASRMALITSTLLFAALCSVNCVAIEFWEWRRNGATTIHPLTAWLGARLPWIALGIAMVSLVLLPFEPPRPVYLAGLLSAATFIWLSARSDSLPLDALRFLADAALLSPVLLLVAAF